jgi:hypothetical protein
VANPASCVRFPSRSFAKTATILHADLDASSMEIRSTSGVKSLSTFMTAIARPIVSISVAQRRFHTSPQWAIASSVAPPAAVGRGGCLDLGYALTKVRYGPFTTPGSTSRANAEQQQHQLAICSCSSHRMGSSEKFEAVSP